MKQARRIILIIAAAFSMAVGANADLMPLPQAEKAVWRGSSLVFAEVGRREASPFGSSEPVMADTILHWPAGYCFGQAASPVPDPTDSPDAVVLQDGHGSFDLCLYALVGLGLFRSGHWVRGSSLGLTPDWYRGVSPWQIGCSGAAGRDLWRAQTVCFVQPDAAIPCPMPNSDREMIPLLVRASQFVPTVLASRGPPSLS